MSFCQVDKINMLKDLTIFNVVHDSKENVVYYLASNTLKPENIHPCENQYYTLSISQLACPISKKLKKIENDEKWECMCSILYEFNFPLF